MLKHISRRIADSLAKKFSLHSADETVRREIAALKSALNENIARRKLTKAKLDDARRQREKFKNQRDESRTQRDLAEVERNLLKEALGKKGEESFLLRVMEEEEKYKKYATRTKRLGKLIHEVFRKQGLNSGKILEIGGRNNPYSKDFEGFQYWNLDLTETDKGIILGDITNCPQIPDQSFDAVISVDVFEHINRPWLAAKEIGRILRPGGITFHSTLFSWRYHPCPIDYWRYTPECLKFLFEDFDCVLAEFDAVERRRNMLGKGKFLVPVDALGGWRENWRVNYAGIKK